MYFPPGLAAKGALIGLGAKALKAKVASLGLPRPTFVRPPLVLEKPVMIQPVPYPVRLLNKRFHESSIVLLVTR